MPADTSIDIFLKENIIFFNDMHDIIPSDKKTKTSKEQMKKRAAKYKKQNKVK